MIVEELIAALGVEVDQASINRVSMAFDAFGKGAFAVASAVAGAFVSVATAVYKTAESGDQLAATAEKLGLTTDTLQELNYATMLTDTSTEALATGLKFLGKNAAEAALKGGDAAEAFAGIKLKENGKVRDLDQLFGDIADKFTTMPDAASKVNLAMKIFGRSGTELIPMLNKGREGIAAFREEARTTGYVLSGEAVDAAQAFDDSLKRLNARLIGWRNRLAAPLIEKFTKLLDRMSAAVMKNGGFFDQLATAIGHALDGLEWFLAHENAIRAAIWAVTTALVAWGLAALSAAIASGTLSFAAVSAAIAAAAAWLAATLPLILFAGLLALVIDDLYAFATGGKSALGNFIDYLSKINPDDSPLIKMLKAAGSLVFDLTNPKRWAVFGQAIAGVTATIGSLVSAVASVVPGLGLISALLPSGTGKALTAAALATVPGNTGALLSGFFSAPGAQFDPSGALLSASPTVSMPRGHTSPNVYAPQISVTVPPGTDAHGVASTVKQAVEEHWERNMRSVAAQSTGHTR